MRSFGGAPKCARCSTSVYAAEQIMGPGRKACLRCTSCDKRLDSFALVEHDEKPYCKICHVKLFGTVDLRHGNLPTDRDVSPRTRRVASPPPAPPTAQPPPPAPQPRLAPTRSLSPERKGSLALQALDDLMADFDVDDIVTPAHGNENYAHAVPAPSAPSPPRKPLVPTMTGRAFAVQNPQCARCGKSVYFAEQVKAVGKTWHKACLRCAGCGRSLNAGQLVDREGDPFCKPCYGKHFGPAGSGYALLGKAGA
ncbi:LIM-domain-containing protein [Epithele typhae]|uniref:LIM-domain-containing protein n=1 Tax=Epithele typhae TaxID=378194 RepID=UPI002007395D|nr:LIM-domain-containing protein [Epithele typhae]KAH9922345.1 LIM-domain-containing protein [Epithele typhae]